MNLCLASPPTDINPTSYLTTQVVYISKFFETKRMI